jgi:hypothetical protein
VKTLKYRSALALLHSATALVYIALFLNRIMGCLQRSARSLQHLAQRVSARISEVQS